jgi:hypothetical protein
MKLVACVCVCFHQGNIQLSVARWYRVVLAYSCVTVPRHASIPTTEFKIYDDLFEPVVIFRYDKQQNRCSVLECKQHVCVPVNLQRHVSFMIHEVATSDVFGGGGRKKKFR